MKFKYKKTLSTVTKYLLTILIVFFLANTSFSQKIPKKIISNSNDFNNSSQERYFDETGFEVLMILTNNEDTIQIVEQIYWNKDKNITLRKDYGNSYNNNPNIAKYGSDKNGNIIWTTSLIDEYTWLLANGDSITEPAYETDTTFFSKNEFHYRPKNSYADSIINEYSDSLLIKTIFPLKNGQKEIWSNKYNKKGKLLKSTCINSDTLVELTRYKYRKNLKIKIVYDSQKKVVVKSYIYYDRNGYCYLYKEFDSKGNLILRNDYDIEYYR